MLELRFGLKVPKEKEKVDTQQHEGFVFGNHDPTVIEMVRSCYTNK